MTRSHKHNDVPKNSDEPAPDKPIPKFFGKTGFTDQAPSKVKKNGGGKGNWGHEGEEFEDLSQYTTFKPRRRSNSISHVDNLVPSKFDQNDPEPVFEDELETVDTTTPDDSLTSASPGKA